MKARATLAYIIEPRFPGGTSSAVAQELVALHDLARIEVHAVKSPMFGEREVAPVLQRALDDLGISLIWDAPHVSADTVILHNPVFLKFSSTFRTHIATRHLIVVTHENFVRPGGFEPFDVAHSLGLLQRASLAHRKSLAPISTHNRKTVTDWLAMSPGRVGWSVLEKDWHNICDFPLLPPTGSPSDRRGRHSRPGFEKFPALSHMDECFPAHADANVIVGADTFLREGIIRPHWTMIPFQGIEIDSYFDMIDFMVYFTAPTFRESFGRVLAEGVAAGKVVISDRDTGSTFGSAVVSAQPAEVDAVIAHFLQHPKSYAAHVLAAQDRLKAFSGAAFREAHQNLISGETEAVS